MSIDRYSPASLKRLTAYALLHTLYSDLAKQVVEHAQEHPQIDLAHDPFVSQIMKVLDKLEKLMPLLRLDLLRARADITDVTLFVKAFAELWNHAHLLEMHADRHVKTWHGDIFSALLHVYLLFVEYAPNHDLVNDACTCGLQRLQLVRARDTGELLYPMISVCPMTADHERFLEDALLADAPVSAPDPPPAA